MAVQPPTPPKNTKPPIIEATEEKPDLRKKEQPLVKLQVTNPIRYLKSWWKRVIGNEGMEFRFRIKPLTAIAITIIIVTVSFGIGNFRLPFKIPFFTYYSVDEATPTPTADPTRETAFTGTLRFTSTSGKYYLLTSSSEAIKLDAPENIDLSELIGDRVFATGVYNEVTRTLSITDSTNMEVLPVKVVPVPTLSPSPTPTPSPTPSPVPTDPPSPTASPSTD